MIFFAKTSYFLAWAIVPPHYGATTVHIKPREAGFKMQKMATELKGLELLFEVNNDRMLSVLAIAIALAAVGWVGVEYVNSTFVESQPMVSATFL